MKRKPLKRGSRSLNAARAGELVEGRIVAVDDVHVWVDLADGRGPVQARICRAMRAYAHERAAWPGRAVLVLGGGESQPPTVIDFIEDDLGGGTSSELREAVVDGRRLVFEAKEQIVLRCGKASITLTRAGKVLIRGAYLSNRSSGANRILGGSVQIN